MVPQAEDERRRLVHDLLQRTDGRERIATVRDAMQKTMEESAGIFRSGPKLAKAADRLDELEEQARRIGLDDHSRTFNTELVTALELQFMVEVARTMVASALKREESRGAHQRTDFPKRDDQRFLAHSLCRRAADGSCRIEYLPVTITRWPPGERVYGR